MLFPYNNREAEREMEKPQGWRASLALPVRLFLRLAKRERTRTWKTWDAAWSNLPLFGEDSFFPSPGVAVLVENGDKLHDFRGDSKIHGVWKPAQQSSPNVDFDFWKLKWALDDPLEDGIKLAEEFVTQSSPSLFIPCRRIADIEFSLGQDCEASHHWAD